MAAYTTIDDPTVYFVVKKWAGNNSGSGISLTFGNDTAMSPDLVWVKSHDAGHSHVLYDTVRTSPEKYFLKSDDDIAERTAAIGSFDSDGVTFSDADGFYNGTDNYIGWFWKESAIAGFDIVAYAGNSTARTISHDLSAIPDVIWIKNRDDTLDWRVYAKPIGEWMSSPDPETDHLKLNETDARADDDSMWNDTAPTSSVFSLKTSTSVNGTDNYVGYLWRGVQGFSAFGNYKGNGDDPNGTFQWCGFSPEFVIIKRIDSSDDWKMVSKIEEVHNPMNTSLKANTSVAKASESDHEIDFYCNGFQIKENNSAFNASGGQYLFMAWARAPFVNSKGVPCNAQ